MIGPMAAATTSMTLHEPPGYIGPQDAWALAPPADAPEQPVLAIDTATRTAAVALCRGSTILAEHVWHAAGTQTQQVLPEVARLCARAGIAPAALGLVAVAIGPGSFTGLRVGVSLGKGMALALRIPLVGIPTLDSVAYQQRGRRQLICAVVDAGRGQVYAALYRPAGGPARSRLRRVGDYATLRHEELAHALSLAGERVVVCGEVEPELAKLVAEVSGGRAGAASPAACLRRPAFLAELARWRLAEHGVPDAAALQPLYLRRAAGEDQAARFLGRPAAPR